MVTTRVQRSETSGARAAVVGGVSTEVAGASREAPALRGLGFAAQEARLAPGAQAGFAAQEVQRSPAKAAGPTPAGGAPGGATGGLMEPGADVAVAPGHATSAELMAPGTETETPEAPLVVDDRLSAAEVAEAMAMYRSEPLPFEAMAEFQGKIGVAASGVIDAPTVQRVAAMRLGPAPAAPDEGQVQHKRKHHKAPASKAHFGVPTRAFLKAQGVEFKPVKDKFGKGGAKADGAAPAEDAACQAMFGMSYAQYLGTLGQTSFLGRSVVGHGDLLSRLAAAERFLLSKYPEVEGDTKMLGKRLGITSVSDVRPSTAKSDQMNHAIGFAVDLNPGTNPWVFGNTGRSNQNKAFPKVLARAAAFMGRGKSMSAASISEMAGRMTTLELAEQLGMESQMLAEYRALDHMEPAALEKLITQRIAESPEVKALGDLAFWKTKIPFDNVIMGKYIEDQDSKRETAKNPGGTKHSGGFMDLQPVVIQAMRDVAGLRWGATDMGKESGDMMHFDGKGTIGKCDDLRSAINRERAKLAADAPAKGTDAKS